MTPDLRDDVIDRYFANAALKRMVGEHRIVNLLISVGHILDLHRVDYAVFRERLILTRTHTTSPKRSMYVVDTYVPEEGMHTVFAVTIRDEAIQFDTFEDGEWVKDLLHWEAIAATDPFGEVRHE